jgi:hypothetical protein
LWFSFWRYGACGAATQAIAGVGDSDNHPRGIWFGSGTTASRAALYTYNGTTWTRLVEETVGALGAIWVKHDIEIINYGDSVATVNVYADGTLLLTYTGDIDTTGVSHFDCVLLGYTPSVSVYVCEFIVADEDTRTFSLVTLPPNASGDASAWTGGWTDIDDITTNNMDMVYANTNDADMQVNLGGLPAGTYTVKAVKLAARVYRDAAAVPTGIALGIKHGGSFDYGDKQALTTSWSSYERLMNTNPVHSAAWDVADIAALQLNLRSKT